MFPQTCLINGHTGLPLYPVILRVHLIFTQIFHFNRSKSAQSCVQSHLCKADSFYFKSFNETFTKMETSCRRCNGSFMFGINCLISFFIILVRLAFYISWEWRLAEDFEHLT